MICVSDFLRTRTLKAVAELSGFTVEKEFIAIRNVL